MEAGITINAYYFSKCYKIKNTSCNVFDQIHSEVIRDKSKTMGENYRCHAGQCKIRDKYFVWNFARTDWLNKSCTMRVNDYERENEIKTVLDLILRW